MNNAEIASFLLYANREGYAKLSPDEWEKGMDGQQRIVVRKGNLVYVDEFVGGEPFAGWTRVLHTDTQADDKSIWVNLYRGSVAENVEPNFVYEPLRKALASPSTDMPVRGPEVMVIPILDSEGLPNGQFTYLCKIWGDLNNFNGEEVMTFENHLSGQEVFRTVFQGGAVNLRTGNQL